jgi:hypothetical protein
MTGIVCAEIVMLVVLLPTTGSAQSYPGPFIPSLKAHLPEVTAATAPWQVNNEPIYVQGLVYYPTRATRVFDGNVMTQMGVFRDVPIYADVTIEPFSLIYIPIAPHKLRIYERLRDNELAATTGSRTPTFPVAPISEVPYETDLPAYIGNTVVTNAPDVETLDTLGTLETVGGASGTMGTLGSSRAVGTAGATTVRRTHVESIPRPHNNDGIWIRFNGTKYYSSGGAVSYDESRFTKIGEYRGFPVYRTKGGDQSQIWVTIVQDGPIAPYARR